MAQGEFWRDGVREFAVQVKLGDFGEMTTREARGKAKEALGSECVGGLAAVGGEARASMKLGRY